MDACLEFVMGGNWLLKVLLFQAAGIVFVLFVLKKALDRELFSSALEQLAGIPAARVEEVFVLTAGKLPPGDMACLEAMIRDKFAGARLVMAQDPSLWGGVAIRAGDRTLDFSLLFKVKQLFRTADQ